MCVFVICVWCSVRDGECVCDVCVRVCVMFVCVCVCDVCVRVCVCELRKMINDFLMK